MTVSVVLPNGLSVAAVDAHNAALVYDEVFAGRVYFRHGVAVADGDCVFDVGANIGLFLVQLNQMIRRGRVFCFEPIPAIFDALERNAAAHGRLETRLFNFGLGRAPGAARFAYFPHSPADSSLYPDDSPEVRRQGRDVVLRVLDGRLPVPLAWPVRLALAAMPRWCKRLVAERVRRRCLTPRWVDGRLRTLADVIDELHVERIDLLKMDVEGAEFEVLAGLGDAHWPRLRQVVVESHGGGERADEMCQLLGARGFGVERDQDPIRPNNWMIYASRAAPPPTPS